MVLFLICFIPSDISSAAITIMSVHKDYLIKTPLTIDATPSNYNVRFTDRTGNNSLNFTINNTQETLDGTRNLTLRDIQITSHFIDAFHPFTLHLQNHIKKIESMPQSSFRPNYNLNTQKQ